MDDFYPSICLDGQDGVIMGWNADNYVSNIQMFVQRIDKSGVVQWTVDGTQVSTAPGFRIGNLVSDGNHGAICFFTDTRNDPLGLNYDAIQDPGATNLDIYAQRFDGTGNRVWTNNGIVISTALGNQEINEELVADGQGGGIVSFFNNYQFGENDGGVYAQRINNEGVVQWTSNGIVINSSDNSGPYGIAADGAGGAVILTQEFDYYDNQDPIYSYRTQKVTAKGVKEWGENGIELNKTGKDDYISNIVTDGTNNFIFSFFKHGTDIDSQLRAQKINALGILQWGDLGALVCDAMPANPTFSMALSDNGSAIISWADLRNEQTTHSDIYASKILSNGRLAGSSAVSEYITTANGNWDSPATWVGGVVPPAGAMVIVRHQVTITQNVSRYSLKAETLASKVTVAAGVTVNITH